MKPMTWNEAAHALRAEEGPEDFGHSDCSVCEAARAKNAASRVASTTTTARQSFPDSDCAGGDVVGEKP